MVKGDSRWEGGWGTAWGLGWMFRIAKKRSSGCRPGRNINHEKMVGVTQGRGTVRSVPYGGSKESRSLPWGPIRKTSEEHFLATFLGRGKTGSRKKKRLDGLEVSRGSPGKSRKPKCGGEVRTQTKQRMEDIPETKTS